MLKNALLLFARTLLRQKLFSAINLLGLTVSLTSAMLVYLYVAHELSFDTFHHHSDRLYRVNQTFIWGENNNSQFSRTGPGVAHALKEELPEVELVTSLHTPGGFLITYTKPNNEVVSFEETEVLSADSNFFRVLNFPLIKGDSKSAFRDANTLMLTRSTARKYFSGEDPIGKFVRVGMPNDEKTQDYQVTGVIEDVPENSTIQFEVLLSSKNFDVENRHWSWIWTQLETFVLIKENADMDQVRERLKLIPEKRAEETLQRVMNVSFKEYIASGKTWELFLQPITSLHLPERNVVSSFDGAGNLKLILSLVSAAIFIILLSCINFMNLSTAQFSRRIKEVGVRKILGLSKANLAAGYFLEALIFCLAAAVVALALTQIVLPFFSVLTERKLQLDLGANPPILFSLVFVAVLMAAFSSFYPALFLSQFKPVEAVKGKIRTGKRGVSFRNSLVILQFAVSIVLMICTAVVFQQLSFVAEKDLGFDKENIIRIRHVEGVKSAEALANELMTIPGVTHASRCTYTPPEIFGGDKFIAEGSDESFSLNYTSADDQFVPALGIRMKAGRNFSKNNPSDVYGVIVNESTLRKIGWPADDSSLGKRIALAGDDSTKFEILGIASDFNYWSLASDIEPMAIFHINNQVVFPGRQMFLALKLSGQTGKDRELLFDQLQENWKIHAGGLPFEYGFIDQYFEDAFRSQQRFGYVLTVIAGLAILIACLGLLGMIIYSLEQRTKEIGIRKVSGASSWNILSLISVSYVRLIVAAFIIAVPVSYFMMQGWLEDFAYRVTPSPWIFALSGVAILLMAFGIAGYHSIKAARTNPVDVLKDE
jgi:putative ABC transport system permease protein